MPTGSKADPPVNSARVAFSGTYLGSTWVVVHWFQLAPALAPIPVADLDAWTTLIANAWETMFELFCNTSCHWQETFTTLFLPDSQKRRRAKVADVVGEAAGDPVPAQVSILIDWQTIDGRRGGKPRSYMPAPAQNKIAEATQVGASSLAALNAAVDAYVAEVNAITSGAITATQFVEMSFVTGGAYRVTPVTFDIDSGYVRTTLATQRRRCDRAAA